MSYTLPVITLDDGELGIELPQELVESLGWNTDTELAWEVQNDGKIILSEKLNDTTRN